MNPVRVIGGGLAGCEAAWQLARAGVPVRLIEMRPTTSTPVHRSGDLAELVCSNSFRGDRPLNAVGVLKREMEALDSLIIGSARAAAVPAGGALAVDRSRFSSTVTAALAAHPLIELDRHEVVNLPDGDAIIATGPLTSPALHQALNRVLEEEPLAFFDAIAPIVTADSLDLHQLFRASRYDHGGGEDYLNAAMDRALYDAFVHELLHAERVPFRDFEQQSVSYFEGCLPIEVMAERGHDTLRFGPMKPVGLEDPRTGRRPWAVVQLRQDDAAASQWNLVGFQTKLTQAEQKRVFGLIPGLASARFARFGMIHRNTFINAPRHLDPSLRLIKRPTIRLAGQISGVEGYVESAAIGLLAGRFFAMERSGRPIVPPPAETAHAGLLRHLQLSSADRFQPSNITWGLMVCPEGLHAVRSRRERREQHGAHAVAAIRRWAATP